MIISGHAAPAVLLHIFRLSMLMQIFLSRSHPAPNMPLRLIHVQYLPRFPGKGWVDLKKSFGDIFMYRTLADPKLLRRLPHSRVILYNIISNLHGSFLNVIFQKNPPANILFTMYAENRKVMPCLAISNPNQLFHYLYPSFYLIVRLLKNNCPFDTMNLYRICQSADSNFNQ